MSIREQVRKCFAWICTIGLSGILVEPLKKILSIIPWQIFISRETWEWSLAPRFSIVALSLWSICTIMLWWLLKKLKTSMKSKNGENSLENYLKEMNSFTDSEKGIKVTWDVGFGSQYNNDPFPYNIRVFCLKHGEVPLQMPDGNCMDINCINAQMFINESNLRNQIESLLLHERDKAIQLGYK